MSIPDDLQYTSHDEWVRVEGDVITVGITDYAQDQLGELVHVDLPEVGADVSAGEVVCEVESVKAVAEIYAPVSGQIAEINSALEDAPESINSEPYKSWIYKIKATSAPDGLMSPADYTAKVS